MKRSLVITKDRKLSYVGNAKAGNTTIFNLLFYYDHQFLYPYKNIYESKNALNRSPIAKINALNNTLVFSFVRNPFRRILSCFFSKVVSESDEKYFFLRDRLVCNYSMNPKDDNRVNFKKFLFFVKEQFKNREIQDVNVHWRPQIVNLSLGQPRIDYIGRIEKFQSQITHILYEINAPSNIFDFVKVQYNVTGSNKMKLDDFFDKESINLVLDLYKEDFEAFGYSKELIDRENYSDDFIHL